MLNIQKKNECLFEKKVTMVVSCRAVKLHGGVSDKDLKEENLAALEIGWKLFLVNF